MPALEGKIAIITGAGSGIGRATALRFAAEGAAVMSTDIDEQSAQQTAAEIARSGGNAAALQLDVADGDAVAAALQRTVAELGGLDVIHNNAGSGRGGWDGVMGVNLTGVYHGLIHGAALLAERGGGAIVNTASIAGLVATTNTRAGDQGPPVLPGMAAYQASKHGVVGLTRTFAVAYAPYGVRVNAVAPGWVESPPMRASLERNPAMREQGHALHPMGRIAQPEEIAAAVQFLASDDASFVTGVTLPVDGGYTAQ